MSIERMTDRTLPLAERVTAAVRSGMNAQAGDERFLPLLDALDGLLADVAAADRLARAAVVVADAAEQVSSAIATDWVRVHVEWNAAKTTGDAALAAYRARMAQGVGRG